MRRWLKLWTLLFLAACVLTWPWVSAYVEAWRGARYFREKFTLVPGRDLYIALADEEVAEIFGGHAGLGRLAALSRDLSITPGARANAAAVASYIQTGGYLRELQSTEKLADHSGDWEWAISLRYRYFREWIFMLFA
ncbi:MAG TPA: hypothetical protein VGM54_19470 [Chthoniobacter sp.]|jgi:hypothetical protein